MCSSDLEARRIFAHAPQYHWHAYSLQGVDEDARKAIEGLGHTLFDFGHQTESRLSQHDRALRRADDTLSMVRQEAERVGASLTTLQAEGHGLASRVQATEREVGLLQADMQQRLASLSDPQNEMIQLREEVSALRLDGARKMADVNANVQQNAEVQRLEFRTGLSRQDAKLQGEMQHLEDKMAHFVRTLVETELAPCKEQIQTLIEQNSELAAFKEQLTELADAQAILMRTVEGLQNSGEGSEDTSSDVGDECPREISPIATVPHTRNPFRIQDSVASPGMCSGSSSKGDSPSPWAKGAR